MVEVARDEAEAGRREGVTRSSMVLEVGLFGVDFREAWVELGTIGHCGSSGKIEC